MVGVVRVVVIAAAAARVEGGIGDSGRRGRERAAALGEQVASGRLCPLGQPTPTALGKRWAAGFSAHVRNGRAPPPIVRGIIIIILSYTDEGPELVSCQLLDDSDVHPELHERAQP